MKIIYIAGPYTGSDYLEIDKNIAKAREAAAHMAQLGIGFFCPHLNSAHFECVLPEVSPAFWYELDFALLEKCDALLLLDGWGRSSGAMAECERANALGLPVFEYQRQFSLGGDLAFNAWRKEQS